MESPGKFRNAKGLKNVKSLKSLNVRGTDEEQILCRRPLSGSPWLPRLDKAGELW
jgi:hypothetical protein